MTLKKAKNNNLHILQVKKKNKEVYYLNKGTVRIEHFNLTILLFRSHWYSSFSYEQGNMLFVLHLGRLMVLHPAEAFILHTVLNEGKLEENRLEKHTTFLKVG